MISITVENVSYSYHSKYQTVCAVNDVSCALSGGKLHALIGKSGSGKTTLLSLLAGLERPQSGKILLDGQDLQTMDIDKYRRTHASVIYQSYNLFPLMTVLENVMYPLLLLKNTKTEAAQRAKEVLTKVGLGDAYWHRLPAMLSGGEQQRVAIARALAIQADIILADEPTGNLDAENSQQIVALLQKLAHEEDCCILIVTHDADVSKVADVIFRMDSGKLTEDVK